MDRIEFLDFNEKEEENVREMIESLIYSISPQDADLEVRKIGTDYHISPKKDCVGYEINMNKNVLALEIKMERTDIKGVADEKRMYYFHQFPFEQ